MKLTFLLSRLMPSLKYALLFVLATTFQNSFAGVTAELPIGGGAQPHYFSGTSCRISGHVGITGSTKGLQYARMKINDETVWEKTFPNPARGPWQVQQNVYVGFSSTHFADGADAYIELYVEGLDGSYTTTAISVPIENKAHVYSNSATEAPWWPSGSRPYDIAKAAYQSMNHGTSNTWDGYSWDKTAYLGACYWTNGGYVNVHGLTDELEAANGDIITNSDILTARTAALGTGLPPYNSPWMGNGGRPMMNIVFHTCCYTAINNDFGTAYLYPGETYYGSSPYENQGFIGFDAEIAQRAAVDTCTAFYDDMEHMVTALDAINDVQTAYDANYWVTYPPGFPSLVKGYGDDYARLVGVYTGTTSVAPHVWYLVTEA